MGCLDSQWNALFLVPLNLTCLNKSWLWPGVLGNWVSCCPLWNGLGPLNRDQWARIWPPAAHMDDSFTRSKSVSLTTLGSYFIRSEKVLKTNWDGRGLQVSLGANRNDFLPYGCKSHFEQESCKRFASQKAGEVDMRFEERLRRDVRSIDPSSTLLVLKERFVLLRISRFCKVAYLALELDVTCVYGCKTSSGPDKMPFDIRASINFNCLDASRGYLAYFFQQLTSWYNIGELRPEKLTAACVFRWSPL